MQQEKDSILTKMAKDFWLNYFNEYFYEKGLITEEEKIKIHNKIDEEISKL